MSVLIKGMKMPKEGLSVVVDLWNNGKAYVYGPGNSEMYDVVELPDHGDLIDRDEFEVKHINGRWYDAYVSHKAVLSAPVIIPAERSGEGSLCGGCDRMYTQDCGYCERVERSEE